MRACRAITVVGCHAGGEVGNVVVGGVLPPPGDTVFEKMQAFAADDSLRRLLLREPRGSVAQHANLIVPSARPDCAAGFVIMEPTEYPAMSGSNAICVATVLLETGMVPVEEPETVLRLEAPVGVVEVRAACRDGRCESVELTNVPCFADRLDARLEVEGIGTLVVDVSFGGMWYAIADASELGFALEPHEARDLADAGERIRLAARAQLLLCPSGERWRSPTSRSSRSPSPGAVSGRPPATPSSSLPAASTARQRAPNSRRAWPCSTPAG
jgi:proline racemase